MRSLLVRVSFCLTLLALSSGPLFAGQFKAGAATSDITPELGGAIVGGFSPIVSKHVHDPLHARCLVLNDGETTLAIVVCDLLGIHQAISEEARALIEKNSGIPPENVLICATHTHSACSALGKNRFTIDAPLDDYQRFVAKRIADGVACAKNLLRPAEIAFGTVGIPEHVFNRRWYLKPGTMPVNPFGSTEDQVKMNPPRASPNLVKPAGPTDPVVSILAVREESGAPIAVFASYSLHYVGGVGPGHISADYFGMFCDELTKLMHAEHQEPPFVPMLANGTSGDINNVNFREPGQRKGAYEQMRFVANDVAGKVQAKLNGLTYKKDISLAARYREPSLKFRHPDPRLLNWAEKTVAAGPKSVRDLSYIYAERAINMSNYPEEGPIPLQVLRIGDVCIGTMPCEVFAEIGLEFKQRCPQQPAFLMSLSHGYLGYLPPPHQHDLGGYETWLGTNRLEREASDKMLAELLEMAAEVQQKAD